MVGLPSGAHHLTNLTRMPDEVHDILKHIAALERKRNEAVCANEVIRLDEAIAKYKERLNQAEARSIRLLCL